MRCPACQNPISSHQISGMGDVVRCPSCGHAWLEAKAIAADSDTQRPTLLHIERPASSETEVRQLMLANREALETFQLRRRHRRAVASAWLILSLVAISPAVTAIMFPEKVVAAAPVTLGLYEWFGRDVNIYGLEIRNVELQHLDLGKQKVIAIRGELFNISTRERKIPWLRFGLVSGEQKEVYHWQLDTQSRPLRPGEAKAFVTRVASPPGSAAHVEIRFARANEIGSNTSP